MATGIRQAHPLHRIYGEGQWQFFQNFFADSEEIQSCRLQLGVGGWQVANQVCMGQLEEAVHELARPVVSRYFSSGWHALQT